MDQPTLLQLSKPRAWMGVFIPFVLGLVASGVHPAAMLHPTVGVFALYFTLPANLLLYGVEHIDTQPRLRWQIIASQAPFFLLLPYLDLLATLVFVLFVFMAVFYTRPPIAARHHPVLKHVFSVRYLLPAVFGFLLLGGSLSG